MSMKIDGLPILVGQMLFFSKVGPTGKKKYVAGKVPDLNEHVKAIKLEYVLSVATGRVRHDWFPLAICVRQVPVETEAK